MSNKDNKQSLKYQRFGIIIFFMVIVVLLLPQGSVNKYANLKKGFISPKDIYAPFPFEILKNEEELEHDRSLVVKNTLPHCYKVDSALLKTEYKLNQLIELTSNIIEKKKELARLTSLQRDSTVSKEKLIEKTSNIRAKIKDLNILYKVNYGFYFDEEAIFLSNDTILKNCTNFINRYKNKKYLDKNYDEIVNGNLKFIIIDKKDTVSTNNVLTPMQMQTLARQEITKEFSGREYFDDFWKRLVMSILTPNIAYDIHNTNKDIDDRKKGVPLAKGVVKKGEFIVAKNMVITEKIEQQIFSMIEKEKELNSPKEYERIFNSTLLVDYVGKSIIIFLPILFFLFMFKNSREREYQVFKKFSLIFILIALQLIINYVQVKVYPQSSEYLISLSLLAILVTIFYDSRMAFISVIVAGIYTSFIMSNNFFYLVIPIIPGVISIYSVHILKDRYQLLYKPFISILATQGVSLIGFSLFLSYSYEEFFEYFTHIVFNALLSPMMAFGLIVVVEKLFKLPTDITLLELSDMTHPLLQKLQREAPGTYHHSLVVGNLAEAASASIGANSLLARVGAYYHDIGKTSKPDYFIENQQGKKNKHDKISPSISAIILSNHVKLGYKMAKEYKLPDIIIDFIRTHHGTTKMEYFYNKALQEKKDDEKIDESIYSYPGPKPQTKETAILMIADVTEARCRSIEKPDYDTYKFTIDDIIRKKFKDGELDECDLKLNDLSKIRDAMLPVVMGTHHSRIKYPGNDKK